MDRGIALRERAQTARQRARPAALLADHVGPLYRAAYALCGSPVEAEDLVQETFLRALTSRRPHRHVGRAYLMKALRNTWIDRERARAARPATSDGSAVEWLIDASADPQAALDLQAAYDAIRELPPPLREAIAAVDVAGLSYKEAARALRIRQGTLMSRLSRARDRVAAVLDDDEGGR
jgi:RNA polymerase sigma-70 factor, ECF subfamily